MGRRCGGVAYSQVGPLKHPDVRSQDFPGGGGGGGGGLYLRVAVQYEMNVLLQVWTL